MYDIKALLARSVFSDPIILCDDSYKALKEFPDGFIDVVFTSPPYFAQRIYGNEGIGNEPTVESYVSNLLKIFDEVYRVLKPTGSFWLNIGDSYLDKSLLNVPARLALALCGKGWFERNEIIWEKSRGSIDSQADRFRNSHEILYLFTKSKTGYFFDADAIRVQGEKPENKHGKMQSPTGINGKRYRQIIDESSHLTYSEKRKARAALKDAIKKMETGEVSDFRMVIRQEGKVSSSSSLLLSGRAEELAKNGFYFLFYNPKGVLPTDVWTINPDNGRNSKEFSASFPLELCRVPLMATCPKDGIVLDPFMGLGTTCIAAMKQSKKSIGIEINPRYAELAKERVTDEQNHHF